MDLNIYSSYFDIRVMSNAGLTISNWKPWGYNIDDLAANTYRVASMLSQCCTLKLSAGPDNVMRTSRYCILRAYSIILRQQAWEATGDAACKEIPTFW